MERTIKIGEQEVRFKATAGTARRYRERFNSDIFSDITKLAKASNGQATAVELSIFENLAYIMAKQADPTVPDDPDEWLDTFEIMPFIEVLPQLLQLWGLNVEGLEESKKKAEAQPGR